MPKVSIIIPVYNASKYLAQCIESVLAQTLTDFELILVNDGSTDESEKICLSYKEQDSRIKYFYKENGGAASARRVGFEQTSGEYIGWVDSDDWIEPEMFESLYNEIKNKQADISACGFFRNFPKKSKIILPNICNYYESTDLLIFSYCNKLIKKELFQTTNITFPDGIAEYEDVAVMFKLICNAKRICFIREAFYHYRMNSHSVTHSFTDEQLLINRIAVTENNLEYSQTHTENLDIKILARRMVLTAKQSYLFNSEIFNPVKWRSIHPEINYWKLLHFFSFYNRIVIILALLKFDKILYIRIKISQMVSNFFYSTSDLF